MKIPFLNSFTGSVLCEIEIGDEARAELRVKVALEMAVKAGANLYNANLRGADLHGADLHGADLYNANLYNANLYDANLRDADLYNANLYNANLYDANLHGADLHGADLYNANLYDADLHGADLYNANLRGANLRGANLDDKTILSAFSHCPEEGAFIAWKKLTGGAVAKLEIPAKAKRTSSLVGRKMRAEFVKVLAIFGPDGSKLKTGFGSHDGKTKYVVGKITKPDSFDPDPRVECTHGIHFFITRKEAESY
jgi:hypothetical protein